MAGEHRVDGNAHLWRMIRGSQELARRGDAQPGAWRVTFVAPEDVPLPPMVKPDVDVYSGDYEETLEERVGRWAQATGDEESIWTVRSVLAFATIESYMNEDGDGDSWIKSVQQARDAGAVDRDLSWLLLDRITVQMIPGELDDPYQANVVEKFWDVEDEYGAVDELDEDSVRNAPEAWQVLPLEMGCGSGSTCWRRFRTWTRRGVWQELHAVLLQELSWAGEIDWSRAALDSSTVAAKRGATSSARIRRIKAERAASAILWRMPRASRSQSS